jgi:aspartyl-tRNA(Asn)/glutamyl-tRNA(Gln) amidotransferase subunit B
MNWETVIGLEVHVELATRSKLFCSCPNRFGEPPNSLVCPVCLGLPGVLPVVNRRAVEMLVLAARALNCQVAPFSKFDRKHYFYPDMPKNFQISQYDLPLATRGHLEVEVEGRTRRIGIRRIHLEEDTGKSVHHTLAAAGRLVSGRLGGSELTLVDYNRAGVPLLEIVSEPDLRSPLEAREYFSALRELLRWLEVSDCKLEEGRMRCDANVSVRPAGSTRLGTKVEIKNISSISAVATALAHEAARQVRLLEGGGRVVQETRGWDEESQTTLVLRSKEEAHDYRYFPEPDLPPLEVGAWVEGLEAGMPELPRQRLLRYREVLGLPPGDCGVLVSSRAFSDFFEAALAAGGEPRETANLLVNEVRALMNQSGIPLEASRLGPEQLAGTVRLISEGKVSKKAARQILERLFTRGGQPEALMAEMGLGQISGEADLLREVRSVLAEHPEPVADYRAGKEKALNVLVGQVMKRTRGRANPEAVRRLLQGALEDGRP